MKQNLLILSHQRKRGILTGFNGPQMIKDRLQELGFQAGLEVQFLGQVPFSGPRLFSLGQIQIALREEEAQCANIELLP